MNKKYLFASPIFVGAFCSTFVFGQSLATGKVPTAGGAQGIPPVAVVAILSAQQTPGGLLTASGLSAAAVPGVVPSPVPGLDPATPAPEVTVEVYQEQLRKLWASERQYQSDARRGQDSPAQAMRDQDFYSKVFREEQRLARQIAVARGRLPNATVEQLEQARIAEIGLRIDAHISTITIETIDSWAPKMEALRAELREKTAHLPRGVEPDFRGMALE